MLGGNHLTTGRAAICTTHLSTFGLFQCDVEMLTEGQIITLLGKSNEKKIPFDFMKVLYFIKHKEMDFGLIVAPYNYAHNSGVWNAFECARQYRWWLAEFATPALMSKVAVIGYDQYAEFSGQWRLLDSAEVKRIKEKARGKFQ